MESVETRKGAGPWTLGRGRTILTPGGKRRRTRAREKIQAALGTAGRSPSPVIRLPRTTRKGEKASREQSVRKIVQRFICYAFSAPTTPYSVCTCCCARSWEIDRGMLARQDDESTGATRDEEQRRENNTQRRRSRTTGASIRRSSEYMPERKGTGKTATASRMDGKSRERCVLWTALVGWWEAMMCVCVACVSVFGRGARA